MALLTVCDVHMGLLFGEVVSEKRRDFNKKKMKKKFWVQS